MATEMQRKAVRVKYIATLVKTFGVPLVEDMLSHEPFLGVVNALCDREAEGELTVDGELLLAHMVGGFATGKGVEPFPAKVCFGVLIASMAGGADNVRARLRATVQG